MAKKSAFLSSGSKPLEQFHTLQSEEHSGKVSYSFHLKVIEKLCQISYDCSSSSDDKIPLTRVPRNDSIERLKWISTS